MGARRLGSRAVRRPGGSSGSCSSRCSRSPPCSRSLVAIVWVRAHTPRLTRPARGEGTAPGRRPGSRRRRRRRRPATRPTLVGQRRVRRRPARRASPARAAARRRGSARAAYRFPTDRRGRFEVGPLRATVTDPFGLVQRTRRVLGAEQVIVYPRVRDVLPPPEIGRPRPRPRASAGALAHRAERRVPHACASTRPATTCATCTGGRPRAAGT